VATYNRGGTVRRLLAFLIALGLILFPGALLAADRIEAESMVLTNYVVDSTNVFPWFSGKIVKTTGTGSAKASYVSNMAGYYDLKIAYIDESDGVGKIAVFKNDVTIDQWTLNLDVADISSENSYTSRIILNVPLNPGDVITIQGIRHEGEFARVDYLELIPLYSKSLTLGWDVGYDPDGDLAGYRLHYKMNTPGPPYNGVGLVEGNSPIDVGNVVEYALSGLQIGVYYFVVSAYDARGNISGYSNELVYEVQEIGARPPVGPPSLRIK
jgi:hypothetical protein